MSGDLKDLHDQLHSFISDADEKLDSLMDSPTASKTRIINEKVTATEQTWSQVVSDLSEQLSNAPVDIRIGVYYGIVRGLASQIGKPLNETIEELAQNAPQIVPLISAEEGTDLQKKRSEAYTKLKQLVDMAVSFDLGEGMELAKKRSGKTGSKGPRKLSLLSWSIGDKEYENLKAVVADYDQYEKQSELTAAMREADINTADPGDRVEFTMPDGEILIGVKRESDEDDDEDDDDDEIVADDATA